MISVWVAINETIIMCRTAHRVKEPDKNGLATYKVDDGSFIKHKINDGAKELAKKLLDTVVED